MKFSEDIIGKVIAQYLGAKVDISNTEWYKDERKLRNRFIEAKLSGVNLHEDSMRGCIKHNIETNNNGLQWLDYNAFKLILKPLSSITDEDAIEVAKMWNKHTITVHNKDSVKEFLSKHGCINYLEIYQFLISRYYDIPQLLLNGKTLFEAGLALRPLSELTKEHMMEIAEHLGYNEQYMNKEFLFEQSKKLANIEIELSVRGYEIQTLHKLQKQTA